MKSIKRECPACHKQKKFRLDQKTCGCLGTNPNLSLPVRPDSPALTPEQVQEVELQKLRHKQEGKEARIAFLENRVLELEKENQALISISGETPQILDVPSFAKTGDSESALVILASDWHNEEPVYPEQVGNRNEHNLEINKERVERFNQGYAAWYKINHPYTKISKVVFALLGDFFSGSIHDDLAESNLLPPAQATLRAKGLIADSLKYALKILPRDITVDVVCHNGNHGRMTKKQRIATEAGNSLEQYMYYTLRDEFQDEKRLRFLIAEGYHSYVRFFEGAYEIRFHHGHQINYQGGVGGLTIPVNKAIAQWNKAHSVNLDCFGHFHTKFDGGNFVSNGSLIGYNAYGVSIKAGYEKPAQVCFLVNREFSDKTAVMPIFV